MDREGEQPSSMYVYESIQPELDLRSSVKVVMTVPDSAKRRLQFSLLAAYRMWTKTLRVANELQWEAGSATA